MQTHSDRLIAEPRTGIHCSCGKRMSVPAKHAGKYVKCPECGQKMPVPVATPEAAALVVGASQGTPEGLSRASVAAMWSAVGIVVLICAAVLQWHSASLHQRKVADATDRVSQAIAAATQWLETREPAEDGESIEQRLVNSMADELATDKAHAERVLDEVRRRRARHQADTVFTEAKRQIEGHELGRAMELLRQYISSSHATQRAEAERLLAQMQMALSDQLALESLIALSDEDFEDVRTGGDFRDDNFDHPVLVTVWRQTVQRNIVRATEHREALRLAALERERQDELRRQAEAALKEKQQRAEEEARAQREYERLLEKVLHLSRAYAMVEMEIDRRTGVVSDELGKLDGTNFSAARREGQAIGYALRKEGTSNLRTYLRELKTQNVDPKLQQLHQKYIAYLEATIAKFHTVALALEGNLGLLAADGGEVAVKAPTRAYIAWETEWGKWVKDKNWKAFVKAVRAEE